MSNKQCLWVYWNQLRLWMIDIQRMRNHYYCEAIPTHLKPSKSHLIRTHSCLSGFKFYISTHFPNHWFNKILMSFEKALVWKSRTNTRLFSSLWFTTRSIRSLSSIGSSTQLWNIQFSHELHDCLIARHGNTFTGFESKEIAFQVI